MKDDTPEIFVYKMVVDNGGAPCVTGNVLSLAICKPKIRKSAREGSLIFGFGGKKYKERLIYIACVTNKLERDDYYQQYARRPDCIYKSVHGRAELRKSAKFHKGSDQLERDVGKFFENAFVLISKNFRYFGNKSAADYKIKCPNLKNLIEGLKQGHRKHHCPALRDELLKLKEEIWKNNKRMKIGNPSDVGSRLACNTDCPSASC